MTAKQTVGDGEMPTFVGSAYSTATYSPLDTGQLAATNAINMNPRYLGPVGRDFHAGRLSGLDDGLMPSRMAAAPIKMKEVKEMPKRRLVKVIIADPDNNVPLNDAVLYTGNETLTDATDQELFFEINIKEVLDKHNGKRVQMVNKQVKERTEYLEPARIRDLKMVVVTIAELS